MKKKVLVVDDSEVVCAMASDALGSGGFDVVTASNGIEANRYLFRQDKPDVILLDVMIPSLSGDKIARFIKDNPYTRHIPILLISSKSEEELQRLVLNSGAAGFVRKPFSHHVIVSKVTNAIACAGG